MKTHRKNLSLLLAIVFTAAPVYAAMESTGTGLVPKGIMDFQRSSDKPSVAFQKYQQYKSRLTHSAANPSSIRIDGPQERGAKGLDGGTKPSRNLSLYQNQQPIFLNSAVFSLRRDIASGKPSTDWQKIQLRRG